MTLTNFAWAKGGCWKWRPLSTFLLERDWLSWTKCISKPVASLNLFELKFSKKKAIQEVVLNSSDEIKQLKNSTQSLRDELEKVIKNYEKKIQK